jgi:hypothetical protein
LNRAGIINVFLEYLLLVEPFMFLVAIVSIPMTVAKLQKFKKWIVAFCLSNLLLAIAQGWLIRFGILRVMRMSAADEVQGVFYLSGAGNYVSATISMCVALYYLISAKTSPLWIRAFWFIAAFHQLLLSDSKQVLIALVAGWILLLLTKVQNIGKLFIYLACAVVAGIILVWCVENVESFAAFKHWANRSHLYAPNGLGTQLKLSGFSIIISHYESSLNWFFGLGPGHTIGRLGGWVLREYSNLLAPLGATTHPVSAETWELARGSWLFLESSMFSPLFSWVGLWGDLGFLGVGAYIYLWLIVWSDLGQDDFSKFLILSTLVFGFIFTQTEEPGYMLFVTGLIGCALQERRINRATHNRSLYLNVDVNHAMDTL